MTSRRPQQSSDTSVPLLVEPRRNRTRDPILTIRVAAHP